MAKKTTEEKLRDKIKTQVADVVRSNLIYEIKMMGLEDLLQCHENLLGECLLDYVVSISELLKENDEYAARTQAEKSMLKTIFQEYGVM